MRKMESSILKMNRSMFSIEQPMRRMKRFMEKMQPWNFLMERSSGQTGQSIRRMKKWIPTTGRFLHNIEAPMRIMRRPIFLLPTVSSNMRFFAWANDRAVCPPCRVTRLEQTGTVRHERPWHTSRKVIDRGQQNSNTAMSLNLKPKKLPQFSHYSPPGLP